MESERDDDLLQKQISRIELSERLAFIQEMLRELSDRVVCTCAGQGDEHDTLLFCVAEILQARVLMINCTQILNKKYIEKSFRHSLSELGFSEQINRPNNLDELLQKKRNQREKTGKSLEETTSTVN